MKVIDESKFISIFLKKEAVSDATKLNVVQKFKKRMKEKN